MSVDENLRNLVNSFIARRYLDGEALGYPERVKVTPALYPRPEFLHFHFRSTEQNSHCLCVWGVWVWCVVGGREGRRRENIFENKKTKPEFRTVF